ncbi:uncharacterized protein LOC126845659 [Adelges cooleyi]|uniref:uncharacterized protein LOC126845659 n=1 Tax=Adelges cooleyi TaxID=133065 RepID=UPI0021808661|nr:uncharacterized protein LOC126845659 [Adelges cooleyi]
MDNVQPQDVPHVFRVGIKIPPFWPEDPAVWFAQLEAQFTLANITQDSTKYYHAISQPDGPVIKEVKDIVSNTPETVKNKKSTVSIDRLKPAYFISNPSNSVERLPSKPADEELSSSSTHEAVSTNTPSITTRSGRRVRFTKFFQA